MDWPVIYFNPLLGGLQLMQVGDATWTPEVDTDRYIWRYMCRYICRYMCRYICHTADTYADI